MKTINDYPNIELFHEYLTKIVGSETATEDEILEFYDKPVTISYNGHSCILDFDAVTYNSLVELLEYHLKNDSYNLIIDEDTRALSFVDVSNRKATVTYSFNSATRVILRKDHTNYLLTVNNCREELPGEFMTLHVTPDKNVTIYVRYNNEEEY